MYTGENNMFRFSDGQCELLHDKELTVSAAAEAGSRIAHHFRRFYAACDSFSHIPQLYALCSSIAGSGKDVYVCENTDMASFRFSLPLISADCGIFISGSDNIRLIFFDPDRLYISTERLTEMLNSKAHAFSGRSGKMHQLSSFQPIYIANIRDKNRLDCERLPAGISCGTRSVRRLWEDLFTGSDDEIVFQISSDGQRVNCYSPRTGLIPDEKLRLTFACMNTDKPELYLPDSFHCSAEETGLDIHRFSPGGSRITDEFSLRLLTDPLFVCTGIMKDKARFYEVLSTMPGMASVKREVIVSFGSLAPFRRSFNIREGRVLLTRSGRERLTLAVQAASVETASELCDFWSEKITRMFGSGDISTIH